MFMLIISCNMRLIWKFKNISRNKNDKYVPSFGTKMSLSVVKFNDLNDNKLLSS